MNSSSKILVIGIDGATFKIINPLINKGKLPNISRIMANGVHGVLNSTIPTVSPVAWTSFITGMNPGKHQIFDFFGKDYKSYKFKVNTAKDRKAIPVWMRLSELNKKVLIVGVTMTYPPDPVNGYMISGLGVPEGSDTKSWAYPPDFATEIINNIGKYEVVPKINLRRLNSSDKEKTNYLSGIFDQIENRVKIFKYMWQRDHFDFSMLFFLDSDGISHYFWKYMDCTHKQYQPGDYSDYICKVYEKIDNAIGEVLSIINDDTEVILVSDHGFGPLNKVVFLNNWLVSKGYLKFKHVSLSEKLFSKINSLVRRKRFISKKEIDWKKTRAYFNGTVGNIFINLKDREPEGIVDSWESNNLCSSLQKDFENLVDPQTGEKIVDYVYKCEELFKSKDIPNAPDLVVVFKKGYGVVGEEIALHGLKDTGEIITDSKNWSGIHEPEGVFIAYGKNFKKGYTIQGTNIVDVTPTLLYYFGMPIPENMDGKLLKDIFIDAFFKANPISYTKDALGFKVELSEGYKEDESEEILERLRNLGYIE